MDIQLITKRVDQLALRISRTAIILLYSTGVLLALATSFQGPHYYSAWGYEQSPFTYGTALQMFIAAEMALFSYFITINLRKNRLETTYRPWLWIPVTLAFLYAGMDEATMFHEKVLFAAGEKYQWIYLFVSGTADDIFVIGCGICALLFTTIFIKELKSVPKAVKFYSIGLFLLILAGALDYFPPSVLERRLPRGLEELSEYFAGTSFAAAFLIYALTKSRTAVIEWFAKMNQSHAEDTRGDRYTNTALLNNINRRIGFICKVVKSPK